MKQIGLLLLAVATAVGIAAHMAHASGQSDGESSSIYGVTVPPGYRDWQLIAVNQLAALVGKQKKAAAPHPSADRPAV
jgi:hypothetical protein